MLLGTTAAGCLRLDMGGYYCYCPPDMNQPPDDPSNSSHVQKTDTHFSSWHHDVKGAHRILFLTPFTLIQKLNPLTFAQYFLLIHFRHNAVKHIRHRDGGVNIWFSFLNMILAVLSLYLIRESRLETTIKRLLTSQWHTNFHFHDYATKKYTQRDPSKLSHCSVMVYSDLGFSLHRCQPEENQQYRKKNVTDRRPRISKSV